MELILERIAKRKTYTIGHLYIQRRVDDEYLAGTEKEYFCDTLEPTWRDYKNGAYKVKGRSAIPEGRYAVVISWSPKMKQWLPILLGVPKFEGIRIPVNTVITFTFALGSALAAVAGILFGMSYPVMDPYMGMIIGWKAFIAAVVGGIGDIKGAFIGGFLLGFIEIFVTAFLPSSYKDLVSFVILLVILTIKPTGFFGVAKSTKI